MTELPTPSDGSTGEILPYTAPPAPTPVPEELLAGDVGGPGLGRLWSAVRRYKWGILGLTVLGSAGGVIASRFVHPIYMADATIWIDAPTRAEAATGPLQPGELLAQSAWVDLLKSYTVLDYVVEKERLFLSHSSDANAAFQDFGVASRFRPGRYELKISKDGRTYQLRGLGNTLGQGAVGDSIGRSLGFRWRPPAAALGRDRTIDFTVSPPRDASQRLYSELQARLPEKEASFLRLSYSNEDPQRVAAVVNAVADRYVSIAADLKASRIKEIARILDEQLSSAEKNLRDAESQLETFRVQTITLPSERATPVAPGLQMTENPVMSRYFDMKVDRESLAQDAQAIRQALSSGDTVSVDALAVIGSVQKSPELSQAMTDLTTKRAALRALRQQYTDVNPLVRSAKAGVDSLAQLTIPRLARNLLANLAAREKEMDALIGSASSQLEAIPPRQIEESRMERRVSVAEDLYNTLRRRYEEARLAAETSVPDVRILDRAMVPQTPTSDRRLSLILMAVLGSLGAGLGLAVMADRLDPRLRYPEEISQRMGLPILGIIPGVKTHDGALADTQVTQVLEALRGVRLSLSQAYGSAGPVVVTISSPGAGDGKSFISANLALAYADLGFRTLVVDGDIRRGALQRLLGGTRKPGLTDYLAGHAGRDQIIQKTHTPLLDLIASGTRLQNGPELLSSSATANLMARLRKEYDVILVDSPPLGAGVDPFLWGMLTGNLMVVLRAGRTDRAMAMAKLETLTRMPVRILGAVLNGAPDSGVYRYYSYLSGYESNDETPEMPAQLQPPREAEATTT